MKKLLFLILLAGTAHAETAEATEAKRRFQEGLSLAQAGKYEAARVRFRFASRSDLPPEERGEGWFVDDVTIDTDPTSGLSSPSPDRPIGSLRIWPNPVRDRARFLFTPGTVRPVRIEILDVTGRRVATVTQDAGSGSSPSWRPVDDSGRLLPSGAYFARARDGVQVANARFVWVP